MGSFHGEGSHSVGLRPRLPATLLFDLGVLRVGVLRMVNEKASSGVSATKFPPPPLPDDVMARRAIEALQEIRSRVERDDFGEELPPGCRSLNFFGGLIAASREDGGALRPTHFGLGAGAQFLLNYSTQIIRVIPSARYEAPLDAGHDSLRNRHPGDEHVVVWLLECPYGGCFICTDRVIKHLEEWVEANDKAAEKNEPQTSKRGAMKDGSNALRRARMFQRDGTTLRKDARRLLQDAAGGTLKTIKNATGAAGAARELLTIFIEEGCLVRDESGGEITITADGEKLLRSS